ncbi:MAG: Gp49 family protein [Cyanobacteria bacterium P01_A01_bin.80]
MENKVELDYLKFLLDKAESQEQVFWGKEMCISYKLECGFTITGRCACVNPANFIEEVGRQLCYEDALDQIWKFEGYRLQWKLYENEVPF